VFLTFLTKEVLRDQLKEMRDSIASAKGEMDEASKTFVTNAERIQMEMQLRQIHDSLSKQPIATPVSKMEISQEVAEGFQLEAQSEANLDRISELIDKLPPQSTAALRRVRDSDREQARKNKDELTANAKKLLVVNEPTWKEHALAILPNITIYVFELQLVSLQSAAAEVTKRTEEHEQHLYSFYTGAFYTLNAIGFALALYGALARKTSPTSE